MQITVTESDNRFYNRISSEPSLEMYLAQYHQNFRASDKCLLKSCIWQRTIRSPVNSILTKQLLVGSVCGALFILPENLKKSGFRVLTIRKKKFFQKAPPRRRFSFRIVKEIYFSENTPTKYDVFLLIMRAFSIRGSSKRRFSFRIVREQNNQPHPNG